MKITKIIVLLLLLIALNGCTVKNQEISINSKDNEFIQSDEFNKDTL